MLSRRQFLASSTAATGLALGSAPVFGIAPFQRSGKQILKLSLAAYSMRGFFGKGDLDMPGFIDYCAKLQLDGAELTSYFFPKKVETSYLNDLKRRAHIAGLDISGGVRPTRR